MAAIGPARWARSDSGDTVGPMPGLGGRATTWLPRAMTSDRHGGGRP